MLSWSDIETRALAFQKCWKVCKGDEKQQGQTFMMDFLQVFGVDWRDGSPEKPITLPDGSRGYIDYLLPGKIIIEVKSRGKSLDAARTQVMGYVKALSPEDRPALVMVSDFDKVRVYSLRKDHPYKPFKVTQLKNHVRIFGLLAGYGVESDAKTDIELNTDASYKMARLHDALKLHGYKGHELEVYLVRLLFCLFADDTGIFEQHSFETFLKASKPDGSDLSGQMMQLFATLDTPLEQRMTNLPEALNRFRYVNGLLFSEQLRPAAFDQKMRSVLLECCQFDWTQISPAIFGAMFQGVMNQQERRELGAHYTSEENIFKVINPLFLEGLYDEFEHSKSTTAELNAFHDRLASLTFLDPACGCGNFLIVTYQKLRELEHEVLKLLYDNKQLSISNVRYTRVSLDQFYGIELEGFPCEIAKVSLLLMKHLMDQEISHHFGMNLIEFPIRDNANIIQGNALRMDWAQVVPPDKLNYIIGNPPFVGARIMSPKQKSDVLHVFGSNKSVGNLDYVACWYRKAADMMKTGPVRTALVSTNSITQGEQVAILWQSLLEEGFKIDFAWRTFKWSNEAKGKAAVHCVIVGFSIIGATRRVLYDLEVGTSVYNISPYLLEAPSVFVKSSGTALNAPEPIMLGSMAIDDGHLFLKTVEEYEDLITKDPLTKEFVRLFVGASEFINKRDRWCLWLVGATPAVINRMPEVRKRVQLVREYRLKSKRTRTRELANQPQLFGEIRQPSTDYLLIPRHSSETRAYVPIGFMKSTTICGDANMLIASDSLYVFGVLTSNVHMAWMRTVAGRLKSDYRYSKDIVYNNFIWPAPTQVQRERIEQTAQGILDARAKYPNETYADLYDDTLMPLDLRRAHLDNDKAVWEAYEKAWPLSDETACVAHLMKQYHQRTGA